MYSFEPGRIRFFFFFIFQIISISLLTAGGRGCVCLWVLILHLSSEDDSPLFTSTEVALPPWQPISEILKKSLQNWLVMLVNYECRQCCCLLFLSKRCRIWHCQAMGLLEGGLSGILIGLALSVMSGGALYCKTGSCTLIQLQKSRETHTTYTDRAVCPLMKSTRNCSILF